MRRSTRDRRRRLESISVTGADGSVIQEKKQTTNDTAKFKEEILEGKPGQHPIKIERTYTDASTRSEDVSKKHAYDHKTVLIEKKDDGYHFTINGKELKGEEAGDLPETFKADKPTDQDMDKLMVPQKPVGVGESWTIDGKKLTKLFGDEEKVAKAFDLSKAKATGKLLKAYKKDGHQFGVLEYKIEVPVKALDGMYPCHDAHKWLRRSSRMAASMAPSMLIRRLSP